MVANRHISKIIVVLVAAAVLLCFLAIGFSGKLTEQFGGTGVSMEYESKLFNTDEVMHVDIQMDEDSWNEMLANASAEEYYVCDVVVNGKKVNNVAIRPKGNTSLSAIAMDPDSDRFSLKLEFDHFVDGQTCYGLDKLILNNNYADATNMKEAIIYDIYQFMGADASLYNYAEVSLNGEYQGVYLALEGVEQSFMLRNFGTQDGELYKPDSMEMGGGNSDSKSAAGAGMPDMSGFDPSNMDMSGFDPSNMDTSGFDPSNMDTSGFDPSNMDTSGFDPSNMDTSGFDPSNMDLSDFAGMTPPTGSGSFPPGGSRPTENTESTSKDSQAAASVPSSGEAQTAATAPSAEDTQTTATAPSAEEAQAASASPSAENSQTEENSSSRPSSPQGFSFDAGSMPDKGSFSPSGMGGFSIGGNGGANLNYTDDDLDSYSLIWEGEITGTGDADHRKVVTALKNISEGTDLETYLDIDNILKYMAVHTFAVNMDSLSGSMAHNYYLYEYDGQLNLFPWDYNLSFGGMSMGNAGNATEMVNDAIDTPFSGTNFFDALLSDETYLAQYHAYLQQIVDEYVNSGRFEETYNRIRSQIDELVKTDPTAFYSYEEYETAAQMLYDTVMLRAESIEGQLDGTIPSTDAGQREDSSALVDASMIDLKAMGEFNMGGFSSRSETTEESSSTETVATETEQASASGMPERSDTGTPPEGFDSGNLPEGFDAENLPEGFDAESLPEGFDAESLPQGFDSGNRPGGFDTGSFPDRGGFSPGQSAGQTATKNLIVFGICLAVLVGALIFVACRKRKHK